ncbi:hypothetical protein [Clostridium sp. Marseille-Q2269]|uniref:hypothetical protein n=1 Tax=Clostridium sp. Marseille-Q2269 TaxID=2942205 RepID=UPI00207363A7|nr:hypothetical protein [Clostridium sp. Marseille-Q2269]
MSKKKVIITKLLICFLFSMLCYLTVIMKPSFVIEFSNRNFICISIILIQIIILSYIGAIQMHNIQKHLFEQPELIYSFMDILNYQLFIFSIVYLISNILLRNNVSFINNYLGKYSIAIQAITFVLVTIFYGLKNRTNIKNTMIKIMVTSILIFSSSILELIFIAIYLSILFLITNIVEKIAKVNIYNCFKVVMVVEGIFEFMILLIGVKTHNLNLITICITGVLFYILFKLLIIEKNNSIEKGSVL